MPNSLRTFTFRRTSGSTGYQYFKIGNKMNLIRHTIFGLALAVLVAPALAQNQSSTDVATRVEKMLKHHPVIDGHNDLPWEVRDRFSSDFSKIDLASDTAKLPRPADAPDQPAMMTDIPRLRAGHVGGQFWSVWIPPETTGAAAIQMTIEQIDIVKRMVQRYPADFAMAYGAEDIEREFKAGKIAALIGIEGGHQIGNSMAALRQMYALGARYMTLTHSSNVDWADSATDDPKHHGLTPFGRAVVHEMNRLGMLVDLSHVSPETMKAALEASAAPVMFSHSSARAIVDHPRDVSDDVLLLVARNGGVVMVNFALAYVSQDYANWAADRRAEQTRYNAPPFAGLYIGQPERAKEALASWDKAHPAPVVTLAMVADHFDHIRKIAGVDHVGIGSDFDGIPATPAGLEGVDKFPRLLEELARRGWSDDELAKVASGNILRVLREAEKVSRRLAAEPPSLATLKP
jgi:membrane dipeptidase